MKLQKLSLYKFTLIYGLIIAAIPTVYNSILLLFGLHLNYNYYGEGLGESYTKARVYLLPVVLFIAVYNYRKVNTTALKLKRVMKLGLWVFLISSVLIVSYNLIFRLLIEPDFSTKFYEINREQIFNYLLESHLELGRDYSRSDLESHERTNGSLLNNLMVNIILNFFFTLFFSLIIGLILKKRSNKNKV